ALASGMVDTVVLNDKVSQPLDANAVGTPRTNLQTASGTVRAVLTDSTIDTLIADPSSVAGGQRAAEQRILAETMLITEQRPGAGSAFVLALPRDVTASAFLETVLTDTTQMPWLNLVGLGDIADEPSDGIARQPLDYPAQARRSELPVSVLHVVDDLRARITGFESVLGSNTTAPFLAVDATAISRAESSSWRDNPGQAAQILDSARADLDAHANQVVISNPRLITMTSRKQKIPITVVNNLPEPVTVRLQVAAVNPARLKVTPAEPVTIGGKGSRLEVLVEVEATTSGRFQVMAQLMTPGPAPVPFGQAAHFELDSTAYGAVALAIAGGAAGLLFLLSGVRLYRRMRRKKAPAAAATSGSNDPTPVS
ncbi:MAG: DUF6049 family protein, partial [Trebonia sp.]